MSKTEPTSEKPNDTKKESTSEKPQSNTEKEPDEYSTSHQLREMLNEMYNPQNLTNNERAFIDITRQLKLALSTQHYDESTNPLYEHSWVAGILSYSSSQKIAQLKEIGRTLSSSFSTERKYFLIRLALQYRVQ